MVLVVVRVLSAVDSLDGRDVSCVSLSKIPVQEECFCNLVKHSSSSVLEPCFIRDLSWILFVALRQHPSSY